MSAIRVLSMSQVIGIVKGLVDVYTGEPIPHIKVAAALVSVDENERATILNMAMAGDARGFKSHAEYILCEAKCLNEKGTIHIVTTKIPCAHCATKILRVMEGIRPNLSVHMPSLLDTASRWYESQSIGLDYLKESEYVDVVYF